MRGIPVNRKKILQVAASLLIMVFVLQVFNKTFYLHTHITEQGNIVTHAHPYNKNTDSEPVKSHSHTRDQLLVISSFDFLFPVIFLFLVLLGIRDEKGLCFNANMEVMPACILLKKGRAPPVI